MIKIVVHSPKGGVGKTTLATNIALFLARKGHKVWAYDLAQGGLMTDFLKPTNEFLDQSGNTITTEEMGELPISFPGAKDFDYLVADTDDYYKIMANLLEKKRTGWRAVAPIVPGDQNGLIRIPQETAKLMLGGFMAGQRPNLFIVMNCCPLDSAPAGFEEISKALDRHALQPLLTEAWVPKAEARYHPFFIDQKEFREAIERLLV